jgi:hypothetical protein
MMDATEEAVEIREMEAQLRRLADQLFERSRRAGPDSLELHARGVALQRAAFLLRAEHATESIDLRAASADW